jgi:hexulose-6-phosphate isomerase
VTPPAGKRLLLACKLGMLPAKLEGKAVSLVERLRMAAQAGFDGVDFDQAGQFTPEQARDAVRESGVFVHNAINHAHWQQRLTSEKEEDRNQGRANIEHCLRVSHAAGGSGVLIVVGQGTDGPAEVIEERCRQEIKKLIPLAASLGQMILVENVGNRMMYDADKPPEQMPDGFIKFVDSFNSPWVGMYYDIGNNYRHGQPGDWIRPVAGVVSSWMSSLPAAPARKASKSRAKTTKSRGPTCARRSTRSASPAGRPPKWAAATSNA